MSWQFRNPPTVWNRRLANDVFRYGAASGSDLPVDSGSLALHRSCGRFGPLLLPAHGEREGRSLPLAAPYRTDALAGYETAEPEY